MRLSTERFALAVSLGAWAALGAPAAVAAPQAPRPDQIQSIDAMGDSITKAYNGQSAALCPFADQEQFNWITSDTHGSSLCSAGPEGVFSQAERIECAAGRDVVSVAPNSARSGARMLGDFPQQALSARASLSAQPAPRYATLLMGHNDVCGGRVFKLNFNCPQGSDQDRLNHCRTTPAAFERDFRRGLDTLLGVPDLHVGVASMVRLSQLCNHRQKAACGWVGSCQLGWSAVAYSGWIFGQDNGICGSLTVDCSEGRTRDAYLTARRYRDILERVTREYAAIPVGGASRRVTLAGQTVGGAVKEDGVTLSFSNTPWMVRFTSAQLNCCDCFHPSRAGQDAAARVLFEGLTCTPAEPCCRDTGDALADARCSSLDSSGTFYPGLFQ
jgi:hypothetical protein